MICSEIFLSYKMNIIFKTTRFILQYCIQTGIEKFTLGLLKDVIILISAI